MFHRCLKQRDKFSSETPADEVLSTAQAFELKKRAILEVVARTQGGFAAYPILWILSMQGGDVFAQHRAYVLWNALGRFARPLDPPLETQP
jgi:hypothetical protein